MTCRICGSELAKTPPPDGLCPNCGADYSISSIKGDAPAPGPDPKGKQYNPFSVNTPRIIQPNSRLASSTFYNSKDDEFFVLSSIKLKKKDDDEEDESEPKMYESDEFKQLAGPSDEWIENDDNSGVEDSASALAIDG